jgi:hypothetical protein
LAKPRIILLEACKTSFSWFLKLTHSALDDSTAPWVSRIQSAYASSSGVGVEDKDDVSVEALDPNEEEGGEFNEFLRRLVSLTYSMGEGLCAEACTAMGPSVGTA